MEKKSKRRRRRKKKAEKEYSCVIFLRERVISFIEYAHFLYRQRRSALCGGKETADYKAKSTRRRFPPAKPSF